MRSILLNLNEDQANELSFLCDKFNTTPELALKKALRNEWLLRVAVARPQVGAMTQDLADKYPKYHKRLPEGTASIDTYMVNKLFPVADDTGCIIHARKKLLIPGVRTGGKSMADDVREARDTLTRWLQINGGEA